MSDATRDPTPDELVTVIDIVDTLEELVGSGRRVPFTPSVVVNEEEILELVDRIRVALPDDLVAARHTLEEREQMLERARSDAAELTSRATRDAAELSSRAAEEAERLVREAQARAAELVDEHTILRTATEQARGLVEDADQHAVSERSAADEYAREVMGRLAEQLERWLGTVREGIDVLPAPSAEKRKRKR